MSWLLRVYDGVRSFNLESTLASIGYSKCFDDMSYQVACWRKWQQPEVVVPPAVAEAEEAMAVAAMPEGENLIRLEDGDDVGQEQFYEDDNAGGEAECL
jgi:hypothetical protein